MVLKRDLWIDDRLNDGLDGFDGFQLLLFFARIDKRQEDDDRGKHPGLNEHKQALEHLPEEIKPAPSYLRGFVMDIGGQRDERKRNQRD